MIKMIKSKCVLNPSKFDWNGISYAANYDKNQVPTYGSFPDQQQYELEKYGINCSTVIRTTTLFASPYQCNEFFFCNNFFDQFDVCGSKGALRYIKCPHGKYFNENDCRCQSIYKKNLSIELLLPPYKCSCKELKCLYDKTMYADVANCSKYYECVNDQLYPNFCKNGMHFSTECQQCVPANSKV